MTYSSNSAVAETASSAPAVPLRYRHAATFGDKVRWLPPYRLIPSFASADGQSAVYRRRSQVVLTSDSENDSGGAATSFALPDSEMKVRIDQYGYARLIRPVRSNQHVDPLSNLVDGAADMVGVHTAYELDRIAGRYHALKDEQALPRPVHALGAPKPIDLFSLRRRYVMLAPLVDAEYGSASFVPVTRPAELEVRVSTTGLLIREKAN